jgi:ubiquinol-cytochrome c reductase cytochrome c1 subunit
VHKFAGFEQVKAGKMTLQEYDSAMADLVAYMGWMSEPVKNKRQQVGVWVLLFMSLLVLLAWRLNASYWREVK